MNISGKILCFSSESGNGLIISTSKEKIPFNVVEWNDFDIMPSLGLDVSFDYENNKISSITVISNKEEIKQEVAPLDSIDELTSSEVIQESADVSTEEDVDSVLVESIDETEPNEDLTVANVEEDTDTLQVESLGNLDSEEVLDEKNQQDPEPVRIDSIDDLKGEKVTILEISITLCKAVSNYFEYINENIEKRSAYKKVQGRLDYVIARRFLWTTFNNLKEIDLKLITPKIKTLSDDLKEMTKVYDDFNTKTKHSQLAYEEVFLSRQESYRDLRELTEKISDRLTGLKASEKQLAGKLKLKKDELIKNKNTPAFPSLNKELKILNGTYADVVHMMAELDEKYKRDRILLKDFEDEHRDEFDELFKITSSKYKKDILDILSSQAFTVDKNLWHQAKISKPVQENFKKSGIRGELNTQTYLKYYLSSQDAEKANAETKKLFELYDKLVESQQKCILILLSDANDAMEFESFINRNDKGLLVKAFIDEKKSLQWAMNNSVKILIVENQLAKMRLESYMSHYKKFVGEAPKIIFLGTPQKQMLLNIDKVLPRGIAASAICKNLKELLE